MPKVEWKEGVDENRVFALGASRFEYWIPSSVVGILWSICPGSQMLTSGQLTY